MNQHTYITVYFERWNLYRYRRLYLFLYPKRIFGSQQKTPTIRLCVPLFVVALLVSNEKEKRIMLDRCYAA